MSELQTLMDECLNECERQLASFDPRSVVRRLVDSGRLFDHDEGMAVFEETDQSREDLSSGSVTSRKRENPPSTVIFVLPGAALMKTKIIFHSIQYGEKTYELELQLDYPTKVLASYVSTAANKFRLSPPQILDIMRQPDENCMKAINLSDLQPKDVIKEAIEKGTIWKGSKVIPIAGDKYVFNSGEIGRWTDEGEWLLRTHVRMKKHEYFLSHGVSKEGSLTNIIRAICSSTEYAGNKFRVVYYLDHKHDAYEPDVQAHCKSIMAMVKCCNGSVDIIEEYFQRTPPAIPDVQGSSKTSLNFILNNEKAQF